MHSSTIIASLLAASAVAHPFRHVKKAYKYDIKVVTEYVTVTAGQPLPGQPFPHPGPQTTPPAPIPTPDNVFVFKPVYAPPPGYPAGPWPQPPNQQGQPPKQEPSPIPAQPPQFQPAPFQPAPVQPAAVQPAPVQPTPVQSAPVQVTPEPEAPVVVAEAPAPKPTEQPKYEPPKYEAPKEEPKPAPAPEPKPDPAPEPTSAPAPAPTTVTPPVVVKPSEPAPVANDYATMAVNQHNIHRSNHSAPDVAWNQTLADWAMNTAKTCVFKHDMDQGTGNYGQNIQNFGRSPWNNLDLTTAGANGITEYWYNGEINLFPESSYDNTKSDPAMGADWLHFSAMIWKSTKTVGCATYRCAAGTLNTVETAYTVCNYFPAGNMGGSYGANIGKPLGKATVNAPLN
ncbi:hypothetical protein HYFRA_00002049 [Hymenoscyphus fraxineus]|uniref:SCP domain-containing protein n=1 Tax=Hymenoscyphus fraxineus TaxID=746836 RepID=A0A9N9PP00_9HELO|nr:hypothetical protein HYFRA_00002049 [Hymenoscyphus fraxineus]